MNHKPKKDYDCITDNTDINPLFNEVKNWMIQLRYKSRSFWLKRQSD